MNNAKGFRHRLLRLAIVCIAAIVSGPAAAEKRIALSYDDAPRGDGALFTGPQRAAALIEGLQSVEAGPVVFFVTTRNLETQDDGVERVRRYVRAGHLIANHSHTHPWAHEQSVADFLADIDIAEQALRALDLNNSRPWFRFPFLDEGRNEAKVAEIQAGLRARKLQNGYVTVDTYDWYLEQHLQDALREERAVDYEKLGRLYVRMMLYSAEFYDSVAVQMLGESPVHVLLLHENDLAALYADELVTALRKAGWRIVSPDLAYGAPLPEPESVYTNQGRVFALAHDAGRSRATMWTWAIDEKMIDLQLSRSGAIAAP